MPNALRYYDLPDLAGAIPAPVHAHNLRNGAGTAAHEMELTGWRSATGTAVSTESDRFVLREHIELLCADARRKKGRQ
jgi:hypothetical protein